MFRTQALGAVILSIAVIGVSEAVGDTGLLTRAETNAEWTQGSFTGSIEWTNCAAVCSWTPVLTVQPALPSYSCRGDEALDSDPDTRMIWSGGKQTANGSVPFDLTAVPILQGVRGQRVCVSAIDVIHERDPVCVVQAPILGMDPNTCPFRDRIVGRVLTSRLLSLAAPPTATPTPESPPATTPIAPVATAVPSPKPAPVKLTQSRAKTSASAALKAKYGRKWQLRKRLSLTCSPQGTSFKCRAVWRYRGKRLAASVDVRVRAQDGKIITRVRSGN